MALEVPNEGTKRFFDIVLNNITQENLTLKLFKSNTTPAEDDTASTYTEATFTGYAAVTLTLGSWTVTLGSGATKTLAAYAQQTFTSSANQTTENEYGYYIVGATSNKLYWAERFTSGPFPIANNGDTIKVTPQITGD